MDLDKIIYDICRDVLPAHAEVFELTIQRAGADFRIQLVLDDLTKTKGSFSTDELAEFARGLMSGLEQRDAELSERVSLEMSTPGLERPLRRLTDFDRFNGFLAYLHYTYKKDENEIGHSEGVFRIVQVVPTTKSIRFEKVRKGKKKKKEPAELEMELNQIEKARLYVEF